MDIQGFFTGVVASILSLFSVFGTPALPATSTQVDSGPAVLGSTTPEQVYFTVNVPARFTRDISAPNVVYTVNGESGDIEIDNSLVAGSGISIADRTITNTGILTLVAGSGISVDGNKVTNSGITSLSAGSGISIDGNKITNTYSFTPDYTQSGWTDNGTSITLTTTTDTVTLGSLTAGAVTVDSLTTGGLSLTSDLTVSSGHSLLPSVDLGSDIGSSSFRFNNLWVANINSNSSQSFSGQTTFSYSPEGTTIDEASVLINPTTSVANGQLLGLAIGGYEKAVIDEDGDIILGYNSLTSAPETDYPLDIYGHSGTRVANITTAGSLALAGSVNAQNYLVSNGYGIQYSSYAGISPTSANGLWYSPASSYIFIDSDNNSTNQAFIVAKDAREPGTHVELFRVQENGNVGIGTTSPSYALDVNGVINASSSLRAPYYVTTGSMVFGNGLGMYNSTSTRGLYGFGTQQPLGAFPLVMSSGDATTYTDGYIALNTTGTERLRIASGGNVGIGTTSPNAKLEIAGKTRNTGTSGRIITLDPDSCCEMGDNGYGIAFSSNAKLRFYTTGSNSMAFGTNSTEILRISETGNVGIGTTSPSYKLQVAGTTDYSYVGTQGSNGVSFGSSTTMVIRSGADLYVDGNNQFFRSQNGGVEYMRINSSGNVGIGTTAPSVRLDVKGTANYGLVVRPHNSDTYFNVGASTSYGYIGFNNAIGTNGLVINSSGNVGIGTTNPSGKLDVLGGDFRVLAPEGSLRMHLTGTGDTSGAELYLYNSAGTLNTRITGDNGGSSYIAAGNVGIGTTSPGDKLEVNGNIKLADLGIIRGGNTNPYIKFDQTNGLTMGFNGDTQRIRLENTGTYLGGITFQTNSVQRMLISSAGAITISSLGTGTVYSNAGVLTNTDPSDENLKDNILTLPDGTLGKILGLRPVSYNWKSTGDGALGFVAQEVGELFPELVGTNSDGTLGLYTTQFIPVLAKAIQEQQLRIDEISLASGSAEISHTDWDLLSTLVHEIKLMVDSLQSRFTAMTEELFSKKVRTEELCVGEGDTQTCVTKDKLDELIRLIPSPATSAQPDSSPSPTPIPNLEPSPSASSSATP